MLESIKSDLTEANLQILVDEKRKRLQKRMIQVGLCLHVCICMLHFTRL